MTITAYPYSDVQRARLRAFIMDLQASGAPGCWHPGDLGWGFFLISIRFDLTENVRLWEDEQGRVAGFAWFDDGYLLMQARPGEHHQAVSEQMLAWGRARRAATVSGDGPEGGPPPLLTSAFETDASRIAWLERQGLECRGRSMVLFRRRLAEGWPAPRLPEGFRVRPVAGEHEFGQRASAHREAFHHSRLTDEQYRRLRQQPEYTPELDLVTVAADGTVASFCQCWLDPVNKEGLFEPVGTRPTFERQGLAKAVLAEGLRRMQAGGMETAFVCSNYTNTAAQSLYQAMGFDIVTYDIDFSTA